ncbi:hypothetical protein DFH07DRAFT_840119 [Mycena maculata]|uniref:Uncharacterized protein n=1 Tax=Mycena maculata TaxID=230809 RepID=A0AAD7IDP5_9AGAR|nr:hypothetical protein DFH07DRAFT_840119 [Mycena maculata]
MSTSQDKNWKAREQGAEAVYVQQKEEEQLAALRAEMDSKVESTSAEAADARERDFESGFGGQEDLEDRYATTSGEH